jgi:hypothetical protein
MRGQGYALVCKDRTWEPVPRTRKGPTSNTQITTERVPGSQETAVACSQSVVAVEDEEGLMWDSYRLGSSPDRVKVVQGMPAYLDKANGPYTEMPDQRRQASGGRCQLRHGGNMGLVLSIIHLLCHFYEFNSSCLHYLAKAIPS